MTISRRRLLGSAAAAAAVARAAQAQKTTEPGGSAAGGPVAISSANGLRAVERAMQLLQEGRDPLDAAWILDRFPPDITATADAA